MRATSRRVLSELFGARDWSSASVSRTASPAVSGSGRLARRPCNVPCRVAATSCTTRLRCSSCARVSTLAASTARCISVRIVSPRRSAPMTIAVRTTSSTSQTALIVEYAARPWSGIPPTIASDGLVRTMARTRPRGSTATQDPGHRRTRALPASKTTAMITAETSVPSGARGISPTARAVPSAVGSQMASTSQVAKGRARSDIAIAVPRRTRGTIGVGCASPQRSCARLRTAADASSIPMTRASRSVPRAWSSPAIGVMTPSRISAHSRASCNRLVSQEICCAMSWRRCSR